MTNACQERMHVTHSLGQFADSGRFRLRLIKADISHPHLKVKRLF